VGALSIVAYFNRVVPLVGALAWPATGRRTHLSRRESVARFVTPAELARMMENAGLTLRSAIIAGPGTIAVHAGVV